MIRKAFFVSLASLLCLASITAAAQEKIEIQKVDYLQGVPGHQEKIRGALLISAEEITFLVQGKPRFGFPGNSVQYVAARAEASMRARTADIGATIASIIAGPAALFFHKSEKHLLSVEYLEGEEGIKQLALFNINDHSSRAVKKMIDDRLQLSSEYYRKKDREEEDDKRQKEAQTTPAGIWEADKNTMAGDVQYSRTLLKKGKYEVLMLNRYIGLRSEEQSWAEYRIPIRVVKPTTSKGNQALSPLYKRKRLIGFTYEGQKYLFY